MKGMITAPQPLAVDAGAKVLADGGNAVDAAVTAAFVQMVVTPRSCGVGGFGMMNIHTAANFVGDPAFVDVPVEELLSEERAVQWRQRIDTREKITIPRWHAKESPNTTHLSVVDRWGNVVGLTHSLGSGSDVITQGLGFMYNNYMNCFNPVPGQVNSIEPGKSRTTGMAPTLVKMGERPYFTVGAPGGTRIVTGIVHAILNVIDHNMTATEAIAAPRFDCQGDVIVAHARIAPSVCERVKAMGHDMNRLLASYGGIASVHGIIIDLKTGTLDGGADPGGGGMALSVSG